MYIQPKNEIEQVAPRTIVCTSTGYGGGTVELEDTGNGKTTGEAPKRRTPVF